MIAAVATETRPTRASLLRLASIDDGPIVSILHPTVRATFARENENRLKTLLTRSERLLERRGMEQREIDQLLEPARRLVRDREFWRGRLDGLALYIGRNFLEVIRLPFTVPESVSVADAPAVRSLLPILREPSLFYILAISRNAVRMFRVDEGDPSEVDLSKLKVPLSLAEASRHDGVKRELQSHATSNAAGGGRASGGRHVWHGHGTGATQTKEDVERFFSAVDAGICEYLKTDHAPLIIAAVAYEKDLYRKISKYPYVSPEGVRGNPDRMSPQELLEKARPVARRSLEEPLRKATEAYVEAPEGTTSDDLEEIVHAAHAGRVATTFVNEEAEARGEFDAKTGRVTIREASSPFDIDLLDLVIRQTLLHGGEAFSVEPDRMPAAGVAAAVFRF